MDKNKTEQVKKIVEKGFKSICDKLGDPIADCLADVFTEAYQMGYKDANNEACKFWENKAIKAEEGDIEYYIFSCLEEFSKAMEE